MTATRKPMMAGNWKMHHTHLDAIQVVQKLSYRLDDADYDHCDVVVCPAFTALRSVQTTLDSDRIPISLGAQNCYWEPAGAFTGEVSAPMLAKLNVRYVIVGHSERREIFGETDEMVARKLRAVLAAGMLPILCVGETLDEREAGSTDAKVQGQVEAALKGVDSGIAGSPAAAAVRLLYGGSVKPGNIAALMEKPEIDGALVGGASLDPDEFARVVRFSRPS